MGEGCRPARNECDLLDRPCNRPVRAGPGAAWLSFCLVALFGAADDLISTQLHVLTAHERYRPLTAGPAGSVNGDRPSRARRL